MKNIDTELGFLHDQRDDLARQLDVLCEMAQKESGSDDRYWSHNPIMSMTLLHEHDRLKREIDWCERQILVLLPLFYTLYK